MKKDNESARRKKRKTETQSRESQATKNAAWYNRIKQKEKTEGKNDS